MTQATISTVERTILIVIACKWCHTIIGNVQQGAYYDFPCPARKCRARTVGVA